MNIKKQVKLSFLIVTILIIILSSINFIVFHQVKDENTIKADISRLISLQDNMNSMIKDIRDSTNIKKLNNIKRLFSTYEKQFEQLKERILTYNYQDILYSLFNDFHRNEVLQNSINLLIKNEKDIETLFDKIFILQKDYIKLLLDINSSYKNENKTRKSIKKEIDKTKDIFLIKTFAKAEYYSKETLFQYKDKKRLDKWLANIDAIKAKYPLRSLQKYRKIVLELGNDAIKLQTINKNIKNLKKQIGKILNKSRKINTQILEQIDIISKRFTAFIYKIIMVLTIAIVILIIIISYKVNKNVDLSVDEINRRVHEGLREIESLNKEIEQTQREVVFTMGAIGESRSKETGNHVKRVAQYSKILALHYGLSEREADLLKQASPMHDIGKVAIPDLILNKPGRFNDEERKIMNTHAKLGYDMLKHSNRSLLKAAAIVAYEHHEKYNGKGYPRGLKGEDIHIYGRITAVADVFDALGSDRCYKKAWDDDKIFALFKKERGEHFDPKLVDIFFEHLDEFLKVRDEFRDI